MSQSHVNRSINLEGKVAIVTGSGRGIGRAIANLFARQGAKVVVTARNETEIEDVSKQIRISGNTAISIRADITQEREVAHLVEEAIKVFGQLDILVNNAAVNHPPIDIVDMTLDMWRHVTDVNLNGSFLCMHTVLPHMIERGTGTIINVSSIGGRKGASSRGAYRATKAGLINLTETLAAEVYRHGINVNCICPGGVETEMMRQITHGAMPENLMAPDEVAKVAAFLATDSSSGITGAAIDAFGRSNPLFG